jgi:hypothetical protein
MRTVNPLPGKELALRMLRWDRFCTPEGALHLLPQLNKVALLLRFVQVGYRHQASNDSKQSRSFLWRALRRWHGHRRRKLHGLALPRIKHSFAGSMCNSCDLYLIARSPQMAAKVLAGDLASGPNFGGYDRKKCGRFICTKPTKEHSI